MVQDWGFTVVTTIIDLSSFMLVHLNLPCLTNTVRSVLTVGLVYLICMSSPLFKRRGITGYDDVLTVLNGALKVSDPYDRTSITRQSTIITRRCRLTSHTMLKYYQPL